MECKRHPGQEASFTCMNCGQNFCRQCVQETRESHYCPDCHQVEVERLASKLGPREPKAKAKKEKKKEPVARKEKKEKVKKKQLKKPAEQPVAAPPEAAVAPPPPPPGISPQEKEEFWGDIKEPRRAARRDPEEGFQPPEEPDSGTAGEPALVPEGEKRRVLSSEDRQQAVMVSEGFPTGPDDKEKQAPEGKGKHAAVKERHLPGEERISMQVPMDYDGEVTRNPSYIKGVLWGLLAGVLSGAAYAGLAWWLHSDRGIFGWVIGFAVGVAVAFGSGRHFNWKLGLIAAAIAMFFVSAGRIAYFMMDVRFNSVIPLKLGIGTLFNEALSSYGRNFLSLWLVFFLIAGLVAFVIAFRPPPIRLQISSTPPARRPARRGA